VLRCRELTRRANNGHWHWLTRSPRRRGIRPFAEREDLALQLIRAEQGAGAEQTVRSFANNFFAPPIDLH
jgi:hypothetical protein